MTFAQLKFALENWLKGKCEVDKNDVWLGITVVIFKRQLIDN